MVETTCAQTAIGRGTGSTTASVLLEDGQELSLGAFSIKALATPGHTPGCMSFQLEGMLFCGDMLFIQSCGGPIFNRVIPGCCIKAFMKKFSVFRLKPWFIRDMIITESWSRPSGKNFAGTPVSGMGFRNRISWKG